MNQHICTVSVERIVHEQDFGSIFTGRVVSDGDAASQEPIRICAARSVLLTFPAIGEVWQIEGNWRNTKWGKQLQATRALRQRPSGRLLIPFLANQVLGVGKIRAQALWDSYGSDLPNLMTEENLYSIAAVIAPDRPVYGLKLAAECVRVWKESEADVSLALWLEERGISDFAVITQLRRTLGARAIKYLEFNPYLLVLHLGWERTDAVGQRLLREQGVTNLSLDPRRLVGAVDAVVKACIDKGHTAIAKSSLSKSLAHRLNSPIDGELVSQAIHLGELNQAIVPWKTDRWRLPGCALMEDRLVSRFSKILKGDEPSAVQVPPVKGLENALNNLEKKGTWLHPEQRRAVLSCLMSPLSVLQGGAGTGKTYCIQAICEIWEELGGRVELACLSGKAALRLSEVTGRQARTIHRLLMETQWQQNSFQKDKIQSTADSVRLDANTLLVIDEASMVGLGQMDELVSSMSPGCRLLLVGDVSQLLPVQFGRIYHDLTYVGRLTSILTTIHRQTDASGIPTVSKAVSTREVPTFKEYCGLGAGASFFQCTEGQVSEVLEGIVQDLGGFQPAIHNPMIVTALNEGNIGIHGLNQRFHRSYCSGNKLPALKGYLGNYFCVGEPVIYLRNNYDKKLFNGSLGHITAIRHNPHGLFAQFNGKVHEFKHDELIDLQLAYAITCHKAQGSQVNRVIIPIYKTQLLDPCWLYTAITRAIDQVILIGEKKTFVEALRREPAWRKRLVGFDPACLTQ